MIIEVDAFTPSGDLLGVFHNRIQAAAAVLMRTEASEGGLTAALMKRAC